ncbi:MAG: PilW family protein [Vitreoscilla sp.]
MRRRLQAGMTLIEMMVAIAVSMILSVAVMAVMSSFEGRRRTLGSASDLDQQGSLAMYQIDRWVRSAGSGLVTANTYNYGCRLFAATSSPTAKQLLPLAAGLPAPFASLAENSTATTTYRLAPVVIVSGGTLPAISGQRSDALVVMSSGNDGAQVPLPFDAPPAAASLTLKNVTEMAAGDLLLLVDKQMQASSGPQDCMVTQADTSTPATGISTTLSLAGNYYAATISTRSVTDYTSDALAIDLGGTSGTGSSLPPSFQVVGVGDNNTLYSYDLLQLAGSTPLAQAEGVFEMHAIYGVDTNSDNKIDDWVDASAASAYSSDKLTDGSPGAIQLLKNIRAVRVALILRTALPEKDPVKASTTLSMFSDPDLPASVVKTRTLSSAEQYYRYRIVESTIPVRNNQY